MTTNDIIKQVHRSMVESAAVRCAIDGDAKRAVEIGNAIIAYGKQWTEGFADDGALAEAEIGRIQDSFELVVNRYVPSVDNAAVAVAYNGIDSWILRLFGIEFKGLRYYLNKWFGLGL